MTRSADELVTEFCKRWASPDPHELAGYFTEDAVYHNIPMRPVLTIPYARQAMVPPLGTHPLGESVGASPGIAPYTRGRISPKGFC